MSEAARRFPIGLTVATAVSLAILIGLGGWQLKRLAWKTQLLDAIAESKAAAPVPVTKVPLTPAYRFRRVTLVCPGLATAPFVELYALRDGQAGSRLISLCQPLGTRTQLLVDRGFVADTISARPPVQPSDVPVAITGVLREGDTGGAFTPPARGVHFYARDLDAMSRALNAVRHPGVMVVAETSTNPDWAALVPEPLPEDIPNRHLEYALTWFGLAAALAAVYAALLRRRLKAS